MLGVVELLLGANLFLRMLFANPLNPIVRVIYGAANPLIYPFADMFRRPGPFLHPIALVPDTLVAMMAYLIVAWVFTTIILWIGDRRR